MSFLRLVAQKLFVTSNTYRYVTEQPILEAAARTVPGGLGLVLDAGAGSGHYSRFLLHRGLAKSIVAVEPMQSNFGVLRDSMNGYGDRVRVINERIENTGEPESSIDTILCTQVLEHIDDDTAVVREFHRLLRPGGHALITVPQPPEPFPQPGHVREGYTRETLSALFEAHSFELLRFDWAMTRRTMSRYLFLEKLPWFIRIFPPAWWAREDHWTPQQRQADRPFCLLGLFRKRVS
jgi:SAM-dependent methyltransferase